MQVDEPQRDALADYEEQILQWLQPDETAGQLLRRTYVQPLRTGLPLIDRFTTLRGGQVSWRVEQCCRILLLKNLKQAAAPAFHALWCAIHCAAQAVNALPAPQVLEIASAAGCGRTTALLQVAASCILPGPFNGIDYGGQAGAWRRAVSVQPGFGWLAQHAVPRCSY